MAPPFTSFLTLPVQHCFLTDEEDILFPPPKLTDEDFSPFGSRGGLFREGQGLFDDEDEVRWANVLNSLICVIVCIRKKFMFLFEESSFLLVTPFILGGH